MYQDHTTDLSLCFLRIAAAAAARLEAAGAEPVPPGAAAGRRRVAVVLSEEGVATAVPLQSVVEAGLSQRVLFQEDGQPVILEVLDQETDSTAAEVSFVSRFALTRNHLLNKLTIIIAHSLCYMSMGPFQLKCHFPFKTNGNADTDIRKIMLRMSVAALVFLSGESFFLTLIFFCSVRGPLAQIALTKI